MNTPLISSPRGILRPGFHLSTPAHHAQLFFSPLSEKGKIIADGTPLQVRKKGLLTDIWSLKQSEDTLAQALKPCCLTRSLTITTPRGNFSLRPTSRFRRRMHLLGTGTDLLISPVGILTKEAELYGQWQDFQIVAFATWLTILTWKRKNSLTLNGGS